MRSICGGNTIQEGVKWMEREKINRIYERLEKAILEEDCTYEEAKTAVDKLQEMYFHRKAGSLLKNVSIQKIASTDI